MIDQSLLDVTFASEVRGTEEIEEVGVFERLLGEVGVLRLH